MEWMQSANAKLEKKLVLARLKGPFDAVPQLAYSKIIAKSDKKPSRHFIRSEAFVNENVIHRKKTNQPSYQGFRSGFMGFLYFFWLKTKILKRECWV